MSNMEENRVIVLSFFATLGHGAVLHMSSVRKQPEDMTLISAGHGLTRILR